ncbi:MAG: membrane protein insertion efficiency factor YidD [Ilumatobacteraceae bacterium]
MKNLLLRLIDWYQKVFSYRLSPCRFYPSCSVYAQEAIETFGAWRGGLLTLRRLGRGRPFGPRGYDPGPELPDCRDHARLTKATHEHV